MSSSSPRPEPTAEAPLLQSACNESDAQLANVILNSNEVGKSPATRCGGDATAMRRRCNSDTTAMRPRRRRCNRAKTGAEIGAETSAVCAGISCKYLHIVTKSDIRAAHHCAGICKYVVLCLRYTCKYLPCQVHILLSQLQIHAQSDSYLQIVKCRYLLPSCHY